MSLIFPKKEILYAPMLGTLGGGSGRGFGRGGGRKNRFKNAEWQSWNGGNRGPTSGSIITLTVPDTGVYGFEIRGASAMPQDFGGTMYPHYGKGANFRGAVSLVSGEVIYIMAGALPDNTWGYNNWDGNLANLSSTNLNSFHGGGGGTFVAFGGSSYGNANPLIVAGGGGSVRHGHNYDATLVNARTDFVADGHNGGGGAGGTSGNGGFFGTSNNGSSDAGTPGAGFYNNAQSSTYGGYTDARSFRNGGNGAVASGVGASQPQPSGGFGGGGAGGWGGSAGGGGYSGGGAGSNTSGPVSAPTGFGGGGSNYQNATRVSEVEEVTLTAGRGHFKLWLPV